MLKNIDQQLTGKDTVNIDTGSHIFVKPDLFLDHDQCSGLNFSHIKTCFDQFIDRLICKSFFYFFAGIKRKNGCHDFFLSQLFHDLSQFRLKYYNDRRDQCTGQF